VLQAASVAGAGMLLGQKLKAQPTGEKVAEKPLRFVHLTDMHVPAEGKQPEGYAACLAAVRALQPPADFMITGGDHVMETLGCTKEQALAQWKTYKREMAAGNSLKVYPVLGNHDIWGWSVADKTLEKDALYGKALALDQLGLKLPYYSFDVAKWHFIVLDSMVRKEPKYAAMLDRPQVEWLKSDLAAVAKDRRICVISHIPLLAACVFYWGGNRPAADHWEVSERLLHRDSFELTELLRQYPVRLLISGHIHLYDQIVYNGLTFVCDGAVSGKWWLGPYLQTHEGFGIFDLYSDGRFEHTYQAFEWKR
jgi:3',5'-cyclic AMP phosphodiesterase CpdA